MTRHIKIQGGNQHLFCYKIKVFLKLNYKKALNKTYVISTSGSCGQFAWISVDPSRHPTLQHSPDQNSASIE
jgi:hypothetical protein